MTLKEKLKGMNPDENVKIGTQLGSGWMYAGKVREFSEVYSTVNRQALKGTKDTLSKAWKRFDSTVKKKPDKTCKIDEVTNYSRAVLSMGQMVARLMRAAEESKNLYDREVVEAYPALGEAATNILVEGAGDGFRDADGDYIYQCGKGTPITEISDEGAAALVAAMFKVDTEILTRLYYQRLRKKGEFPDEERAKIAKKEREIRKDVYGLFEGDGEGIINMCRRAAEERYRRDKKNEGFDNLQP